MNHIIFSGAFITEKQQLHSYLKQALDLPEWYGNNLDALADCLGDISEKTVITVVGFEKLENTLGDKYAQAFKNVLLSAAKANSNIHIRL